MVTVRTFRFFIVPLILLTGFNISVSAQVDPCSASIAGQSDAQLRAALDACNADIAKWTAILESTKKDSASFAQEVSVLTAKINVAQSNIKAKNIAIANLAKDITAKQTTINVLDNKIERGRASLAEIIRKTSEIDTFSLPEAILSGKDFSEFFVDVDTYAATEKALEEVFADLRGTKAETEAQKLALSKQQEAEANAKAAIEAAKKQVEITQAQKKTLLAESQNKEKTYAQVVADRQAKAAQIRAVLFQLRDAGPIPFGTALQYAQAASAKTGVRAAFILGVFATESGKGSDGTFGGNVGQCLLTNSPNKGDGKGKNTGTFFSQVMKGTRDVDPFLDITRRLGIDAFSQPVSCPQYGGYGGGMGPAQFIASTWKGMESTIARATGKITPSPWDPADAFMASALYLRDLGANSQDFTNERTAACRYNSGRTCYVGGRAGPGLQYGINVMSNAAKIQQDIDFLQGA
jgi:peptidoglycan hydrolase CwlO-like protein